MILFIFLAKGLFHLSLLHLQKCNVNANRTSYLIHFRKKEKVENSVAYAI